ncbi:MAG: TolC family protein, partial [Bacteroidales bacterium]|nr:TolC family protein [Bacteroidales bacterium]
NTNNIFTAGVMLTQPIYMGGKIMAYNKITDLMAQADEQKHSIKNQELLVQVDQAYWQIVDLQSKKKLAQGYLDLLKTLENNVDKLADNGFATKADALSVKVKRNEAEVTVIQVDNGLSLSRMLLCQICGLPLNTEFTLFDENNDIVDFIDVESEIADTANTVDISNVKRPEISALDLAAEIYRQKVNVVRSEFMPNVVLMGGYVATSPSAFNGFENKFKGMWTVGVGVKVPIVTSGERIYKVKAAKLEADKAACKLDETREKISLQVNQCAQRLDEARRRLVTAKSSLAAADENLRYANVGLKEGMIPVSTVLQAQTAWLQAQSTMVQAQIDVKLAKVNLQKALGQLE